MAQRLLRVSVHPGAARLPADHGLFPRGGPPARDRCNHWKKGKEERNGSSSQKAWAAGRGRPLGLTLRHPVRKTLYPRLLDFPSCSLLTKGVCARRLTCRVTGKVMDADNPPMVLPNGQVFSRQACQEVLMETSMVVCPVSGDQFRWSELRPAYLL